MISTSDILKRSSTRSTKKKKAKNPIPEQYIRHTMEKVIIHHTATTREARYDLEWCRKLHLSNGWRDIGYHIYIEHDGTIKMGRPLELCGAHTKGHNKHGIGICYVGGYEDYEKDPVCTITNKQIEAINLCVYHLRKMTGKELPIHAHREFKATFCPGFDIKDMDFD
jgi:hypothetical protein